MAARIVLLDRDGTINVDHHYVHQWRQWEFAPGAVEALRILRSAGFRLAVVSNQAGIARGYFPAADVDALHARLCEELLAQQAELDAIVYCPHGPHDACACRKPRPGLAAVVEQQIDEAIDYAASWTIGDKVSDIEFGQALGTRTALIASEYWKAGDPLRQPPDLFVASLLEAARRITQPESPSR